MTLVVFDTETKLFRPGVMAPELVCVSFVEGDGPTGLVHVNDPACYPLVRGWLEDPDALLVGHHVPYDLAVVCAQWPDLTKSVFGKFDADRVACTKIRQQLLDIAAGQFRGHYQEIRKTKIDGTEVRSARWVKHGYTLDDLIFRAAGRRLDKTEDSYRMRYGELIDVPVSEWPETASHYAKADAAATRNVFLSQETHVAYMGDQFRQVRNAWARHLTSVWGLRTNKAGVENLERETIAALASIEDGLKTSGLVRDDGSRDTKRAKARILEVCATKGLTLHLTDTGMPSLDADACKASGDELLSDYAELTSLKMVLNKDVAALLGGTKYPVHTSFGLAETARATSAGPNVQNFRRLPGIREAFEPRAGKVYAQGDFSGLELHTFSQVCLALFGESRMAEVLNAGLDPHTAFAATLLGISYEEGVRRKKDPNDKAFDDARQTGKVANFGIPGGLGATSLVTYARSNYNVTITEPRAKELKAMWLEEWPESQKYFAHVAKLVDEDTGLAVIQQVISGRWRGGCHYTSACNSYFQGLGADAAHRALYLVSRACYTEPDSVLYGSRIVNFVHDEIFLETDDTPAAHDVAIELGRLMCAGANEFLPDVPARVEPLLARCWSKKSKPVFVDGKLRPWGPNDPCTCGKPRMHPSHEGAGSHGFVLVVS